MDTTLKTTIESAIEEEIRGNVSGSGYIKSVSGKGYYLKTGSKSRTYRCEANGLKELVKANAIRVPEVISVDEHYILTEFIDRGTPSATFHQDFGRNYALMHRYCGESYGFFEDNFIGANPQLNIPVGEERDNWAVFFFNKRILYQYKLAEKNGYITSAMKSGVMRFESNLKNIFENSTEPPTLLHGDLWSGNYLCDSNGQAVLIDPAVYYGHREADLAMTKVFGGFSPLFYKSYMEEYPLQEGWEYRENIYKLYHILNHLNIFGRSYLSEAEYLFSLI